MKAFSAGLWVLFCLSGVSEASQSKVEISVASPQGAVKSPRQVRVSFSEPMVAFGDPRANADIFEVVCKQPGKARWVDPRNWVYEFASDVPTGVNCAFKLRSGVRSLEGAEVEGKKEFSFITGGPSVIETSPWDGSKEVDEQPVFVLTLDATPDKKTSEGRVYLQAQGNAERIPLQEVDSVEAKKILESIHGKPKRQRVSEPERFEWVLRSGRAFPAGTPMTLVWGKGIAALGGDGAVTSDDQTFKFQVREPFTARFECERENANSGCVAVSAMRLILSESVVWKQAKRIQLIGPSGQVWKPTQGSASEDADEDNRTRYLTFKGPFPEKTQFKIVLPEGGLQDDSGRPLSNASVFPLGVKTDAFPPLAKFAAEFGIIESKPEPVLPVTLRNLEAQVKASLGAQDLPWVSSEKFEGKMIHVSGSRIESVIRWMGKVSSQAQMQKRGTPILDASDTSQTDVHVENFDIPKPLGAEAFEVVGIPLKKPGFYVVQLQSQVLGQHLLAAQAPMFVSTAALVTDLGVHFKQGRESSIAWVTTLSSAEPVEGALISVRDCHGKLWGSGRTDSQGIARLGRLPGEVPACKVAVADYTPYQYGYFVSAEKDEDFSFVHTSWEKGIEGWRFNLPGGSDSEARIAHTVFDRTLLRAGDTMHMKHFVRRHTGQGLSGLKPDELPQFVEVRHDATDQVYRLPLEWQAGGVAESVWKIPPGAKLGEYSVALAKNAQGSGLMRSGTFRVEEFRVPLMKGAIRPPSGKLVGAQPLAVDLSVAYLAGGGAAGLPAQLRFQQSTRADLEFPDFEGYVFSNGSIHEKNAAASWDEAAEDSAAQEGKLERKSVVLDQSGAAHVDLGALRAFDTPGRVSVELEYRDPSGETQTVSSHIPTFPANRLIAVKTDAGYNSAKKPMIVRSAVVDLNGQPLAGVPVSVDFFKRRTYSNRKRLLGGFYAYENREEVKKAGHACDGQTDAHGLLVCEALPTLEGNLLLQASVVDELGRSSFANASTWVYADEEGWFAQQDDDRIDLIAEKKRYEPGEKAVFQLRMPFREATALVTVEREGVIEAFTVPVSAKRPLIEVPILPNYAPNVYVSVLAIRGRVGDVQPTALVDLGRPAYKLGVSEIRVGWKAHELKVKVTPAKELYQVREKAEVALHVTTADGQVPAPGAEVMLAAVDEGLLELKPNESWKLLDAMMARRGFEVRTSTAQSQVVGKRHFGLKALPHGGDGGKAPTRELFDTLLFWQARVKLDALGEAHVTVPLNDSITSFRLVAVASSGEEQFGTGEASIRSTRDLMMFAGVPPLAREGDRFPAEFTLHNSTRENLKLELSGNVQGARVPALPELAIELAASESKTVHWDVEVPVGVESLQYDVEVRVAGTRRVADHLKVTQKIVAAVPVRTFQATLGRAEPTFELPVERPKDALPGRGGLRVAFSPSLVGGLDGVHEYMKAYPYSCLEQRTSKAISAGDREAWKRIVQDLPSYLDHDGLARYFPVAFLEGSEIVTSYVLAISEEAGWELPTALRSKMIGGLQSFVGGALSRTQRGLATADLTLRKVTALEALSRFGEARWAMLAPLEVQAKLWPTSSVLEWFELLKRLKDVPAAQEPQRQARLVEAAQVLRSRLDFQGSRMGFSTEKQDGLWWLMVSPDENAVKMLLAILDAPDWQTDLPRLAQGAIGRQLRGHWDTTTANAWGTLAVRKFAERFEKGPVSGATDAKIGVLASAQADWKQNPKGQALDLPWPPTTDKLRVTHSGEGKPWVTVESRAAIPLSAALTSGYAIKKSVSALEQRKNGQWSKGDIVRVRLEVEAQADMTWVVLSDPVPAGASILGTGLGNDSALATSKEIKSGDVWPAFEERSFESFRAYFEFVPKGRWTTEYTYRLNQEGVMNLPSTRVEAMYAPQSFGEIPNDALKVAP